MHTSPEAALAHRIADLIAADRSINPLEWPVLLRALGIVAARIHGATFDQSDATARHLQAQLLGAGFATVAETVWQGDAQRWPEADALRH